jgi:3-oxoacyl-[acyl-carrier protein] reductase
MADTQLHGRVAVVTGANQGIGEATAIHLATLGADIVAAYLRLELPTTIGLPDAYIARRGQDCAHVVAAVTALGRRCIVVEADLTTTDGPRRIFDATRDLGPASILVNNASGSGLDSFAGHGRDSFGRRVQPVTGESGAAPLLVDARGGALMIAEFARRYPRSGGRFGRIVSLTSGSGDGFPGEVSYGAAKAALENYTLSAARELGSRGITANVVHPPITDTGWVTDQVLELAPSYQTEIAQPEDVATVIGWLCTRAADRVTGTIVRMR